MRYDFFIRTETNRRSWEDQVKRPANIFTFEIEGEHDVDELIALAISMGMPKGSSRSACFEIQSDEGIFSRIDGRSYGRLTNRNSEFNSWDEE